MNKTNRCHTLIVFICKDVILPLSVAAVGKVGNLSNRQKDSIFFINDVLKNASQSTGVYQNISEETRLQAQKLYTFFLQQNAQKSVFSTAIGVDLKNANIQVSPWR